MIPRLAAETDVARDSWQHVAQKAIRQRDALARALGQLTHPYQPNEHGICRKCTHPRDDARHQTPQRILTPGIEQT
jgi:hypothetical protein